MSRAEGSFDVTSWDEDTYEERDGGAKLTLATVEQRITGGIEGDGAVRWLMSYRSDGTAHFVGQQRITGSISGRKGSFVVETSGEFDGERAEGSWTVIERSGTDDFEGLRGTGGFSAPHGSTATFELDYEL